MTKLIQIFTFAIVASLSPLSSAASWYKVEMIVFANPGQEGLNEEHWPEIDSIPEKNGAISLGSGQGAYKHLSGGALRLHGERSRLERSGYRVLFHSGWTQPVSHTQNPRAIRVRGGQLLDNGMYELDGYVAVGRGRYLHFRPDLFMSKVLTADEVALLNNSEAVNTEAEAIPAQLSMQAPETASQAVISTGLSAIPEILTVNLNQARRMRSKELHFIDHPLMGILVEIKPLN